MKAVIFDLDGVIVSTDHLHFLSWKHMTDIEHIDFDDSVNHRLRGVSRMDSLNIILERATKQYTIEEKEALAHIKNQYYQTLLQTLTPSDMLPGVFEVLKTLKEKGVKIAIGSSSKNTPFILKQLQIDTWFDAVADGNEIKLSKPAPDVFLLAAKKLNVDTRDCLVVEDAEAGIEAAIRANMTAVAVSDARKSPLAHYRLDDIQQLIQIIFEGL
jgi:beta-phosphoglucomutase